MKTLFLIVCCLVFIPALAQQRKVIALPDFTFTNSSPDQYRWTKVCAVQDRTLFNNSVFCTDSTVRSFGGFDMKLARREMDRVDGKRIVRDSIRYPGEGFYSNILFTLDSFLFVGAGKDSSKSQYAATDFWKYNLHTGVWTRLKELPFYYLNPPCVFRDASGVITALIVTLHGADFGTRVPSIYQYKPEKDEWQLIPAANETPVYLLPAAFKTGDDIYVLFQSEQLFNKQVNKFYRFSLLSREWTALPTPPFSTRTFVFAASDSRYGYIGGGAIGLANLKDVYRYDPQPARWERMKDLPLAVRHAQSWLYQDELYVGFGINDNDNTIAIWKLGRKK